MQDVVFLRERILEGEVRKERGCQTPRRKLRAGTWQFWEWKIAMREG